MSSLPGVAYRVIDTTELDDLVIWSMHDCGTNYLTSPALRADLNRSLTEMASVKCFSGPLDHQHEFDPTRPVALSLPIVFHILLGPNEKSKAFLYLTNAATELHIPENFLVTGLPETDRRRYDMVRQLADEVRKALGVSWQLAEFGGVESPIDDYGAFWEMYKEKVFERIDYEPLI